MVDVILIADSGIDTFSATNPLRLLLDGHPANIQVARNFVQNGGEVIPPIDGDGECSWESAPKLNGIYLLNYLGKQGIKTSLINNLQKELDRFLTLSKQNPKAIVISTTFIVNRQSVIETVATAKAACPSAKIIVGGPFANFSWRIKQKANEDPSYDLQDIREQFLYFDSTGDPTDLHIISATGDNLLSDVIQRLLANDPSWCTQPNTARIVGGKYIFNASVDDLVDRKEVPIEWSELPDEIFASGVIPMRASEGCPYRCNFCNFNKDPRLTNVKPIDQLVKELKAVQDRGVKYVWFVDDNFRLGKRDLESVCQRFIDEGITLQWMTLVRPETLQNVDLGLLKRAGCKEVQMGLESADPQVLANMNKQSDPELNEVVIKRLISAGINCACYFIFGYPGETTESLATTAAFIRRLEEHDGTGHFTWSLYPFLLAPFSPIFDNREGFELEGYLQRWSHKTMDSDTVKGHLLEIFMSLDKSSPIYRGDNLDLMTALPARQSRAFLAARHHLEKLNATRGLSNKLAYKVLAPLF